MSKNEKPSGRQISEWNTFIVEYMLDRNSFFDSGDFLVDVIYNDPEVIYEDLECPSLISEVLGLNESEMSQYAQEYEDFNNLGPSKEIENFRAEEFRRLENILFQDEERERLLRQCIRRYVEVPSTLLNSMWLALQSRICSSNKKFQEFENIYGKYLEHVGRIQRHNGDWFEPVPREKLLALSAITEKEAENFSRRPQDFIKFVGRTPAKLDSRVENLVKELIGVKFTTKASTQFFMEVYQDFFLSYDVDEKVPFSVLDVFQIYKML